MRSTAFKKDEAPPLYVEKTRLREQLKFYSYHPRYEWQGFLIGPGGLLMEADGKVFFGTSVLIFKEEVIIQAVIGTIRYWNLVDEIFAMSRTLST